MRLMRTVEAALLRLTEDEYEKFEKKIRVICGDSWNIVFIKSKNVLILRQTGKVRPSRTREKAAAALEDRLKRIGDDFSGKMIWGFTASDVKDLFLFPTGKLIVLFKENVSQEKRRKILSEYKPAKIEFYKNIKAKSLEEKVSVSQSKEAPPEKQQKEQKMKIIPVPVTVLTLPVGREHEAFEVASNLSARPEVVVATPDVHMLGKNIRPQPLQSFPPPAIDSGEMISRNFTHRAWELVPSLSSSRYLCSDEHVAVFDFNFFDHEDIRYAWIGYDAADGDMDPRNPLEPPDIATSDLRYVHGTEMSGVIGGMAQMPSWKIGVASQTFIVPIRPSASDPDIDIYEDTDQFFANYMDNWWKALYRLFLLSYSRHVVVANFSIALSINPWILNYLGFSQMMYWVLGSGDYPRGIFAACAAGNRPDLNTVAYLASLPTTFGVGEGDWTNDEPLGNSGYGKDIVVDTGRWPIYSTNNYVFHGDRESGGSSVATAVVSGVAALMRIVSASPLSGSQLKAEELRQMLRLSTRLSPTHLAEADARGFHPKYGYGFLDAYHAVKLAYKSFCKAIQAIKIRYLPNGKPCVLIQTSEDIRGRSSPRPSGYFWRLQERYDSMCAYPEWSWYWSHVRGPELGRPEVVFSVAHMGDKLAVGDFDGDGSEEIALQCATIAAGEPLPSFLIYKFQDDGDCKCLGEAIPLPTQEPWICQYTCPRRQSISQILGAKLMSDVGDVLAIRQQDLVTIARYNEGTDRWETVKQLAPNLSSSQLRNALGIGEEESSGLLHIAKFRHPRYTNQDSLLVIGYVKPSGPLPLAYLTASILVWDENSGTLVNAPVDNLGNTHILLKRTWVGPRNILIGDFEGDNQPEVVIHMPGDELIFLDFHYDLSRTDSIVGHTVYTAQVPLQSQVSELHHGKIFSDPGQPAGEELAYLSQTSDGNVVRFLAWNPILRAWYSIPATLSHGRKDNQAIDIVVGDFNDDGRAEIGILMALLHQNTYRVYNWEVDPKADPNRPYLGWFQQRGYW